MVFTFYKIMQIKGFQEIELQNSLFYCFLLMTDKILIFLAMRERIRTIPKLFAADNWVFDQRRTRIASKLLVKFSIKKPVDIRDRCGYPLFSIRILIYPKNDKH